MAQNMASMVLPAPPSWYPGHMRQFVRLLPALLSRTDVVLELRDARLPLTSINSTFEGEQCFSSIHFAFFLMFFLCNLKKKKKFFVCLR